MGGGWWAEMDGRKVNGKLDWITKCKSAKQLSQDILLRQLTMLALIALSATKSINRDRGYFDRFKRRVVDSLTCHYGPLPCPGQAPLLSPGASWGKKRSWKLSPTRAFPTPPPIYCGSPGEDDVGVSREELAPGLARDPHHLHVLDPPHLEGAGLETMKIVCKLKDLLQ